MKRWTLRLTLPALLACWLTGVAANEYSHVTTTQLYDPRRRDWAWELIDALGFDRGWFGKIVKPGTILYELGGVTEQQAKVCFARLAHKMPIPVRLVRRRPA